jgi:2-polyprenyl-3-methyl-5-hydroxy-6-metoxy-1,4-benzoquinol methylase
LLPKLIEQLRKLEVRRLLDVGAGNGSICCELFKRGFEAVGVEYDEKGVEIARLHHPGIHFYNFGVQDDPLALLKEEEQRKFDAVISTEVIEHLFSPHLLPVYASRVLKENGYLLVTTPYHGYLKNLALAIMNKWDFHHDPLWHGGHIKFWSRATLARLLSENGFRVIGFCGTGRLPFLWKSMILIAQKLP